MTRSILTLLCTAVVATAGAAVPIEIPYQGLAVGPDGARLDGSVDVRFALYDAATGGTEIWNSGTLTLTADRGVITHRLGSDTAITLANLRDHAALHLETSIDGATVSPRQELGSVAYAVLAASVEDDAIGADALADDAVTAPALADDAVTAPALADDAVTAPALADDAVTGAALADGSVDSAAIASNSISIFDIGTGAVGSDEIANNAVDSSEIASNAVDTSEIADGAVGTDELADGGVAGPDLADELDNQQDVTTYNVTLHNNNTSTGGGLDVVGEATSTTAPAMLVEAWRGAPAIWGQSFGLGNNDRVLVLQNNTWSGTIGQSGYTPNTVFEVEGDGDVNIDGSVNTGGADFAESIAVGDAADGGAGSTEPGDVLVIDPDASRAVVRSAGARSTLVAGVHSTRPGVIGEEPGHRIDDPGTVPMAMVGIVPCKVTTSNGAIRPGDLLVTAERAGHAMRADDPAPGTVLGKALAPCDAETGVIRVLLSLQ